MLQWPHSGFHVYDSVRVAPDDREFFARLVTHIPDPHPVLTRYYGWYAKRTRGMRRRALGAVGERAPPAEVAAPVSIPLREARRRWAELLRRIFEVDPLRCPRCGGAMRIITFLTEPAVIDRILTHLRTRDTLRSPVAPAHGRPKDGTDIATPATAIDFPIRDERTPIIAFAAGDLPVCTLFSAGATPMPAPRLEVAEQSNEDDQRNRNSEEEQQNRAHIATSLACGFERVFV